MALGTFAEYITVPAVQVAKLPPNSPLDVLSPIGCAVLTGWGAARAVAGVEIGHRYSWQEAIEIVECGNTLN